MSEMKNIYFSPVQAMAVTDRFGNQQLHPGMNMLQHVSAAVAGPMLIAEIKAHGFEELTAQEQFDNLARIAVNMAKAILKYCEDERKAGEENNGQQGKLYVHQ